MTAKLGYFGMARTLKVDVGEKSVSIHPGREEGFKLAEKILKAANERVSLDIAIHKKEPDWRGSHVSIVSRAARVSAPKGRQNSAQGVSPG